MAEAQDDIRMFPNIVTPNNPVVFDENVCSGCNNCVEMCVMDILMPNPEKGKPPIILYPDECWYCGLCQSICPTHAIDIVFPERMIRNETDVATLLGKVIE